jgi:hypothetical protein
VSMAPTRWADSAPDASGPDALRPLTLPRLQDHAWGTMGQDSRIEVDIRGGEVGPHQFEDGDGYIMPVAPGTGPRRIPVGDFPTGPDVGTQLPDIVAIDQHGTSIDVHADRKGPPAVVMFYRSAVW